MLSVYYFCRYRSDGCARLQNEKMVTEGVGGGWCTTNIEIEGDICREREG